MKKQIKDQHNLLHRLAQIPQRPKRRDSHLCQAPTSFILRDCKLQLIIFQKIRAMTFDSEASYTDLCSLKHEMR